MRRGLALSAMLALAGCTGGSQNNPQPQLRAAATVVKDAALVAAVKAKLIASDPDSATTLGVGVKDGVVTLRGAVRTAEERSHVAADAKGVPGVKSVVDSLKVDPNAPRAKEQVSDLALTARIVAALTAQIGVNHVGVHVSHGVATLDGTVGDEKTRETALATARGTSGIRNVVDRIRIQHS